MNTGVFQTLGTFASGYATGLEWNMLYSFRDIMTIDIRSKVGLIFLIGLGFGVFLYFIFVQFK